MTALHASEIAKIQSEKIKIDSEVEVMHENLKLEKWKVVLTVVALAVAPLCVYLYKQESLAIKKMELCLKTQTWEQCQ